MKKALSIFTFLILISCSSSKSTVESISDTGNYKIDEDNVSIITPYIEIKEKSNLSFINHPDKRKALTEFTVDLLKSQYPNAEYVEIPFLFGDYGTINSKIEGRASLNEKNVPNELVSDKNKNSIFISINGYFGDLNRGVMMLYIIDNQDKKWKMIERYQYTNSPLETNKMEKRILKALEKIK
ncbi:hypothetical protein [Nonlabens sp. Asnod3-H03]|uniref:hypothetical protein n=1 Tax=Nonlabens sp. Asnod3-H03 TaxID=3160580 RepID=UPI00386929D0